MGTEMRKHDNNSIAAYKSNKNGLAEYLDNWFAY